VRDDDHEHGALAFLVTKIGLAPTLTTLTKN
jgi:hypothetical protein